MLILLLTIIIYLTKPLPSFAQIPLSHLLIQSYKPSSIYQVKSDIVKTVGNILGLTNTSINQNSLPTPTPSPQPETLAIGGYQKLITIAILGDSMIDTLADFSYLKRSLETAYPQYIFNIINYGLGASDIEYGLFRLENDYQYLDEHHPSLLSQNPDIIIIESFAYNNFGNTQAGFDKHWLNLGALTTKIKQSLPNTKILLTSTIAPSSVIFGNGSGTNFSALEKLQKTKTINLYLQNLINFSKSQNYPLADAYTPSLKNQDGNPIFVNKDDGIHPSSLGAQFFQDILFESLAKYKFIE